jgi:tetratricopeptide (TPR) repeat protein
MANGELETAESILVLLEPVAGETSEALQASTLANLARLRMLQGRLPLAESLAGQALSIDRRLVHPPAIAADHVLLGEILRLAGRQEEAQRHVDTAGRIYRQTGQALPR